MFVLALLACSLSEPAPPSVLIVTFDTTRADHIGAYGYDKATTPTLDHLAAQGVLFERAYSSCPLTIPSHSTIFTGRFPPSHGVRDNGDFILGPEAVTLAERMQEAGYTTAAFTSAFPTQARWGFDQGFDLYHDPLKRLPTQLDWSDQRRADEVVDDALASLEGQEGPLFVWLHFFDAHWPYEPPPPHDMVHAGRPYDGEIAFADRQLGRFLSWWDETQARSLVVMTADHGEGLGDGGERTHGFLLHDGTIHVPLILRGEGVGAGERVTDPVSHVDIVPTVLSIVGLEPHEGLQGRDLRAGGSADVYSEALTGQFSLGLSPLYALTGPEGRLMEGGFAAWYPAIGNIVSFIADPDHAMEAPRAALAQRRAELDQVVAPTASLDAEALEQLMALGYIGDVSAAAGEVDPRDVIDVIPFTWMARQALGRGDLRSAERALARLRVEMPGTYGVELLDAQLMRARGQLTESIEAYVALYLRSPSSTVALQLAGLHANLGMWAEARSWYEDALALQPASPEAMAGLVRALREEGQDALAQELAEAFLEVYPDHAQLWLMESEMLLEDGRVDEARAIAQRALEDLPGSPWAQVVLAQALWESGEADPAIERLQDALRLDPFDLPTRIILVDCLLEVGRNAEAVRSIRPVARLLPEEEELAELAARAEAALAAERGGR
ncbi:MAG: sulfatase-like hydrolase/transferase [Alphaproteobacteria bacterium]|nr:sulfatase-like hydrolase/transferase [Alphaproteobacteria bacterium]MCB9794235.1 sulfatase-like hydrolase/transferase [Alphaproteobacteria bacterium]